MKQYIEIETQALNADKNQITETLSNVEGELKMLQDDMAKLSTYWEGPAGKAYQNRVMEDVEAALKVCRSMTEYVSCMEYAGREYARCEQTIEGIVNRVRI